MKRQHGSGSIFLRKGIWQYKNLGRGIKQTSLKTDNYHEAVELVSKRWGHLTLKDEAQAIAKGLEKLKDADEKIDKVLQERAFNDSTILLKDMYEEYICSLTLSAGATRLHVTAGKEGLAKSTKEGIKSKCKLFNDWMKKHYSHCHEMKDITPRHGREYMKYVRQNFSDQTYNTTVSVLKKVFKSLVIEGGLLGNPFDSIERIKSLKSVKKKIPFTHEQMKSIYNASKDRPSCAAVNWIAPAGVLAYYTGLRLSDVISLKWENVKAQGELYILSYHCRKTKRKETSIIPQEVYSELTTWRDETFPLTDMRWRVHGGDVLDKDFIFPLQAMKLCKATGTISKMTENLRNFLRELDIVAKEGEAYGFHSFRKSHATDINKITADRAKVQASLHHTDEKTGDTYVFESEEQEINKAIANYLPLNFGKQANSDAVLLAQIEQLALHVQDKSKLEELLKKLL